ncbi:MAG: TauD/TfdA family dioxygenase [Ardenticatenales bacterium]|nr:TauD/TfdA family dioxygenase [Ardenticatenales bacterium]
MRKSKPTAGKLPTIGRKRSTVSAENLVTTSYLNPEQLLPLVIEPAVEGVDLIEWSRNNLEWIEEELAKHGGLLFRNFNLRTAEEFGDFLQGFAGGALEYKERSSPRSQVSGNVYTSTDHPPTESIFLHNEQSYNLTFPMKIVFFCTIPAQEGGETPIASTRNLFQRLPAELRDPFIEKGYLYVRNFGDGFGLSWQSAFQTDDPAVVEKYCQDNEIEFEWKEGNRLRTRQRRRAVVQHPRTGEMIWFNHATFFHVTTLRSEVREMLLREFSEDELPNNTYYGDGTPITNEVMEQLRDAYHKETITFPWQRGDLLLLDNVTVAHGRAPFVAPRQIIVGMAEPRRWEEF